MAHEKAHEKGRKLLITLSHARGAKRKPVLVAPAALSVQRLLKLARAKLNLSAKKASSGAGRAGGVVGGWVGGQAGRQLARPSARPPVARWQGARGGENEQESKRGGEACHAVSSLRLLASSASAMPLAVAP